ncbi:hypothetical protein ACJIZ3_003723 [Penstemon smallii]|uniref:Uncharacterized protein n=1 Tax=Penstemon smallii TaxID=265156 RepID=A0ABD3UAD5_9LAMI
MVYTFASPFFPMVNYMMTPKDYVYISDVLPGKKNLQVKVVLCEKSEPRTSYTGGTRYMRTVLLDEKGQKVVAPVFDGNIEPLRKRIVLYPTYLIKKPQGTSWTLSTQTCITPVVDQPIPRAAVKQRFVFLGQLQKPSAPRDLIDVLVLVIDKGIKRRVPSIGNEKWVRDIGVIDEDNRPLALTLWNNIAESEGKLLDETMESMPIIKVTGLCVSSFYVLDPQIPEVQSLKNWRSNNLNLISDTISEKPYLAFDDSISTPSEKDLTSLADVVSINTVFKFLVRVKVSIVDASQKVYYMSCNECTGGVDAEMGDTYICTHCSKSAVAVPRHKISIRISDDSGSLDVVAFGDVEGRTELDTLLESHDTIESDYESTSLTIQTSIQVQFDDHNTCHEFSEPIYLTNQDSAQKEQGRGDRRRRR